MRILALSFSCDLCKKEKLFYETNSEYPHLKSDKAFLPVGWSKIDDTDVCVHCLSKLETDL